MAWSILRPASTGSVDLAHLVDSTEGWSPGTRVTGLRQGRTVSISVLDLMRAEAASSEYRTVLVLPSAWSPALDQYFLTWRSIRGRVLANGTMQLRDPGTQLDYFTITFQVTSPMLKGGV